jgi:hypothetical protein
MPEFEECIAPPTSPRDIDYDNSELLALRIEKTREKLLVPPLCGTCKFVLTFTEECLASSGNRLVVRRLKGSNPRGEGVFEEINSNVSCINLLQLQLGCTSGETFLCVGSFSFLAN